MEKIRKIYISGAMGMVGRNIQDALKNSPYILLTPCKKELNLLNEQDTDTWILNNQPDLIIHCAGKVGGIQANVADPVNYLADNMRMGLNLVQAALKHHVRHFLNLGSSCMYPANFSGSLTEEMILTGSLEPTNEGYAIAKCAITRLCQYISIQYPDYKYKTIIPCNLYGRYDKFENGRSHMLPAIIKKIDQAIMRNLPQVEIWGDGLARREFMYAGDLADLVRMAVENFDRLPPVMNVGTGQDYTVDEYYARAGTILGYTGAFWHNHAKPAGMRRKLLDVSRQTEFGFIPSHTLDEGIKETYEWYKTL